MKPKYKKGDYVEIDFGVYKIIRQLGTDSKYLDGLFYKVYSKAENFYLVKLMKDLPSPNFQEVRFYKGSIEEKKIKRKITNKKELMAMLI